VQWPMDPLGDRRPAVERGAALVERAVAARVAAGGTPGADDDTADQSEPVDPHGWSRDVTALLTERRSLRRRGMEVELPPNMSATALTELADDPATLARRIRRPVPQAPTPLARRGTAFHAWVERFFTASALLEVADLPGANDSGLEPEPELEELKVKFLRSPWATRVPFEIELPFAMTIGGQPVRGRVDAVFRDDDGGCTVVDWKTGNPPGRDRRRAVTVQLAVYRLAVAEMFGLPLSEVRALFVYVGAEESFSPPQLPDAAGLAAMIAEATADRAS